MVKLLLSGLIRNRGGLSFWSRGNLTNDWKEFILEMSLFILLCLCTDGLGKQVGKLINMGDHSFVYSRLSVVNVLEYFDYK